MQKAWVRARSRKISQPPREGPEPPVYAPISSIDGGAQNRLTKRRVLSAPTAADSGVQQGECRVQGWIAPSSRSTKLPWKEQKAFSQPGGLKFSTLIRPPVWA